MKNNIFTLVIGFGLIIWASIPLGEKPVNVNYQITASAIGVVVCCAAFTFIIKDKLTEIEEKLKK